MAVEMEVSNGLGAVVVICIAVLIVLFAGEPDIQDRLMERLKPTECLLPPLAEPGESYIGGEKQ